MHNPAPARNGRWGLFWERQQREPEPEPSCAESGARDGVVALVGSCCPRSPKSFVLQGNPRASDRRADAPAGVGKRPDLLPVPRESREAASGPSPGLARWGAGGTERAAVQHRGQHRAAGPAAPAALPHRRGDRSAPGTAAVSPSARPLPGTQVKFGFRVAGAGVKGWLCWSKQINVRWWRGTAKTSVRARSDADGWLGEKRHVVCTQLWLTKLNRLAGCQTMN